MMDNAPATTVVVTGLGAMTAAGRGVPLLWDAALQGTSLAQWREAERAREMRSAVCSAPQFELDLPKLGRLRQMDRSVQLAGMAALEAWQNAALPGRALIPERIAIFVGSSRGPLGTVLDSHAAYTTGERVWPSFAPNNTFGCVSGALSTVFEARGPCLTISAACASSAMALALAAQQIVAGSADVVLAGGADAPLHDLLLAQLRSARLLASHPDPRLACRPFDAARNGAVLGEGAAFLVLESLASARKRGAPIYARLAGWAMNSEGSERTGVSADNASLYRSMRDALTMAAATPADVGYINAHGTGTQLNDRMEAEAIDRLGAGKLRIATSSTKPVTGHCMGAAAAIEAVICVLALERQSLPPSANCEDPAVDCPLDLVLNRPRQSTVKAVLSNSAGFWGNNASLLFTPPPSL
jgi:3-oxoacyl-(acyl-carrier-protein) synthase